jgi:hypothetical protein
MILLMGYIHTRGIKTDGRDYEETVGLKRGDTETELQLNTAFLRHHLNAHN